MNKLTNVQIGYSPNDFFYNTSPLFSINLDTTNCDKLNNDITNGIYTCDPNNQTNWKDSSYNCYVNEMCNNKKHANKIFTINNAHNKSNTQLTDTNQKYYYQYIQTINLGIGNAFLFFVILYKIYNS